MEKQIINRNSELILTKKEAAEFLGVSTRTLDRMRKMKKGPACVKVGNRIRYRLSVILKWFDEKEGKFK